MPIVYVEARPKGLLEGFSFTDYVVEDQASVVLSEHASQTAAVTWAKELGYTPYVPRVRHFNKRYNPDHWVAV